MNRRGREGLAGQTTNGCHNDLCIGSRSTVCIMVLVTPHISLQSALILWLLVDESGVSLVCDLDDFKR